MCFCCSLRCRGGASRGWGSGSTGSAGGGTLFTPSLVALLPPLLPPPPAPSTQVTMGAQVLETTAHAPLIRDRRQLACKSLPPAALALGRG
jgi:hypothetical protein